MREQAQSKQTDNGNETANGELRIAGVA